MNSLTLLIRNIGFQLSLNGKYVYLLCRKLYLMYLLYLLSRFTWKMVIKMEREKVVSYAVVKCSCSII